jgi:hypothetical protein
MEEDLRQKQSKLVQQSSLKTTKLKRQDKSSGAESREEIDNVLQSSGKGAFPMT